MDKITISKPDDFHVHFRQGELMKAVLPSTLKWFGRALAMPNLRPKPVLDTRDAKRYRGEITAAAKEAGHPDFEPLMAIQLTDKTKPRGIKHAQQAGVIAAKVYPIGVTTNSDNGVRSLKSCALTLQAMQDCGMVLSLHGEKPGVFCLDREREFLGVLDWLVESFPSLRIVLEHITTFQAVAKVINLPETVAATITVHHLFLTLDDIIGGGLSPHNFCKPVAKRESDREALRHAVLWGNPKFFLGTDSAPHPRDRKECASGCAGVFTAPVAMPLLAQFFEEHAGKNWRKGLEEFSSLHGAKFYGLPKNSGKLTLIRR